MTKVLKTHNGPLNAGKDSAVPVGEDVEYSLSEMWEVFLTKVLNIVLGHKLYHYFLEKTYVKVLSNVPKYCF